MPVIKRKWTCKRNTNRCSKNGTRSGRDGEMGIESRRWGCRKGRGCRKVRVLCFKLFCWDVGPKTTENHRKVLGKMLANCQPCLGNVYGDFIQIICNQIRGTIMVHFSLGTFWIAYGRNKKHILYEFGIFWCVPEPQTKDVHLWRPQDTWKVQGATPTHFWKMWFL